MRLRPVLTVDGERLGISTFGLAVGEDFELTVELLAPGGHRESVTNRLTIGNLAVIGIGAQGVTMPEAIPLNRKTGERLLFERALDYLSRWQQAEDELAALLGLTLARPLPSLVTLGGVVEVVRLLDQPHGFDWQGVYLDADFRTLELVGGNQASNRLFMQLSGLQGSILENRIFEDGFGVASVSTAKLLAQSNAEGLYPLRLDQANLETELPGLLLPANIEEDITNAIHQGQAVTIPPVQSLYEDWLGYGFRKEVPETGEAGWMLSGSIAGGMTAWSGSRWPIEEEKDLLENPFSDPPNYDPSSALFIQKILSTDVRHGIVGQTLDEKLWVLVSDREKKPVKGAKVVFTAKAGGGVLTNPKTNESSAIAITVTSNSLGIAEVSLKLGPYTAANPTYILEPGADYSQQIGENIVDAALESGTAISSPFTELAFPDKPHHLRRTMGMTDSGFIFNWAGPVALSVEDQFNNPIANQQVTFSALPPQSLASCDNPAPDSRPALLLPELEACPSPFPTYQSNCGSESLTTTSDFRGTYAQVILGGQSGSLYAIKAEVVGVEPVNFSFYSSPGVDCQGTDIPMPILVLAAKSQSDNYGNIINAGPVGGSIPIDATCYLLREGGISDGNGVYTMDYSFGARVTMNGQEMTGSSGIYQADYILPYTPQLNDINLSCEATVAGEPLSSDFKLSAHGITIDFPYDQQATIQPTAMVVAVNEQGYTTRDHEISYRINPADYQAGSAYLLLYRNDQLHFLIPSERSGIGTANLARGMKFDMDANYELEVILNPNTGVEIGSGRIPLHVVALELDADLNRDGLFEEDDPHEYSTPGVLVQLNRDDDDGDGVIDFDDGFDKDNIANTADDSIITVNEDGSTSPATDDDLVEVHLTGRPANLAEEGMVILQLIQGQDQVRVWSSPDKGKDNVLLAPTSDPGNDPQKIWVLGHDIANLGKLPGSIYLEGVKTAKADSGQAVLITKYVSPEGVTTEMDRLLISVFNVEMVPDYDRNGVIDDEDRDKVTEEEPWQFWINDDNDNGADDNGIATDASNDRPGTNGDLDDLVLSGSIYDDASGATPDTVIRKVGNVRDLIDFFPLHLNLHNALQIWQPGDGYEYRLSQADQALGIFIPKKDGDYLAANEVRRYLQEPLYASALVAAPVEIVGPDGLLLKKDFLAVIQESDKYGVVLLEGRAVTDKPLVLEIGKEGEVMQRLELPLEILPVEEMYARLDLRRVAGGPDRSSAEQYIGRMSGHPVLQPIDGQPFCQRGEERTLVWMHGYNVDAEAARATYAEVFKRFFHTGYNGRFLGVSWFGDPPDGSYALKKHYHQAVVNAFATAGAFKDFVALLPGPVSIAAHSLGNMVVGSAIQDHGLTNFAKYFAIDAAVALEAYGQVSDVSTLVNPDGSFPDDPNSDMIRVENWPDYIRVGQERLLASEWYKLFLIPDPDDPGKLMVDPNENRGTLTWRNRLSKAVSDRVYNFFSSTEDVLRRYPADNVLFDDNGWSSEALAISAFVKQEKFKGRRSILNPADDVAGASSNYCGWSFNGHYWKFELLSVDHRRLYTPEEAAGIDGDDLKSEPFFALDNHHLFPNPQSLLDPSLDELASPTGSEFVGSFISDTGLTGYYTANLPAHQLVTVRDWLLAEAFPATTLPMGANRYTPLEARNIDMSGVATPDGGCCKTSEGLWPRKEEGVKVWFHSDYKDIPYQHVYEFYKKINTLSGN